MKLLQEPRDVARKQGGAEGRNVSSGTTAYRFIVELMF